MDGFYERLIRIIKITRSTRTERMGEDMATKSITKNIEITDSIKAKRLVEALEVAERIDEDMPEILNKKQLEDAIKCDANCQNCSLIRIGEYESDCIPEIAQTALAYREMLEEVIKHLSHCPFCKINRPWLYKHKDGCKMAALLKESEVEEG